MEGRAIDLCQAALVEFLPPEKRQVPLTDSRVRAVDGGYSVRGVLAEGGSKQYIECGVVEREGGLVVGAISVAQR